MVIILLYKLIDQIGMALQRPNTMTHTLGVYAAKEHLSDVASIAETNRHSIRQKEVRCLKLIDTNYCFKVVVEQNI